jgi:hypothetical protein
MRVVESVSVACGQPHAPDLQLTWIEGTHAKKRFQSVTLISTLHAPFLHFMATAASSFILLPSPNRTRP